MFGHFSIVKKQIHQVNLKIRLASLRFMNQALNPLAGEKILHVTVQNGRFYRQEGRESY